MRRALGLISLGSLWLAAPLPAVPCYDHVVVVVLENHSYQEILNGPAPYINNVLRANGADLTGAYGIQHPSQPNYYWLFSGSNQGIDNDLPPSSPHLDAPNLFTALRAVGKGFSGFLGSYESGTPLFQSTTNYVVRHAAWLGFKNVPRNISRPFASFPQSASGFASLPSVSFVIPGLDHDMHNYDSTGGAVEHVWESYQAIRNSDLWIRKNLNAYYRWARTHNSLLVLTTDEDSTADWVTPPLNAKNADAFTSPLFGPNPSGPSGPNQITMIFAGAGVRQGKYSEGSGVTNVNVLRTIESFYDLKPSGAQSPLASLAGINNKGISNIFFPPNPRVLVSGSLTKQTTRSKLTLSGTSTDTYGKISSVEVKVRSHSWQHAHGTTNWTYGVPLRPGGNRVLVRAIDRSGTVSPVVKVRISRSVN